MKNIVVAAIVSSFIAPAFAAEFERAPELPDLSSFQRTLHESPAPAAASAAPVTLPKPAACPVLDLNGAVVGRGIFSSTYDIEIGGQKVGTIGSDGDGWAIKDAKGNVMAKSNPSAKSWGSKSEITDCSGAKIGSIQEEYSSDGSNFTVSDAQGNPYANTGWTSSSSVDLKDINGAVVGFVQNASSFTDKFKLGVTTKSDPRIVAFVGVLNTAAAYKRSAERRRDRIGDGPHGRADRY